MRAAVIRVVASQTRNHFALQSSCHPPFDLDRGSDHVARPASCVAFQGCAVGGEAGLPGHLKFELTPELRRSVEEWLDRLK